MILKVNHDNMCSIWSQKVKDGEVSNSNFYYRKIDRKLKFDFLQNGYLHDLVLYLSGTLRSCSLWVCMPFFLAF